MSIGDALKTCFGFDGRTYFVAEDGRVWRHRRGGFDDPRLVMTGTDAPLVAVDLATIGGATIVAIDAQGRAWIIDADNIARPQEPQP